MESETNVSSDSSLPNERGEGISADSSGSTEEIVDFKIIFNRDKYNISFPLDKTILSLKKKLEEITKIPFSMQKLIFKGKIEDKQTLREVGIVKGSKVMMIGSTLDDIMALFNPQTEETQQLIDKIPLCRQEIHRKVIERGVPNDVMLGVMGERYELPSVPMHGMLDEKGRKVRLTFKLELDELWISTKERTEKINMNIIRKVYSEPIEGSEEYHIMCIKIQDSKLRYWIYWVPAQYIHAIKKSIFG